MLGIMFDTAMLFGIACVSVLLIGGLIKAVKYLCEKVLKIDIVAWLTSDDED